MERDDGSQDVVHASDETEIDTYVPEEDEQATVGVEQVAQVVMARFSFAHAPPKRAMKAPKKTKKARAEVTRSSSSPSLPSGVPAVARQGLATSTAVLSSAARTANRDKKRKSAERAEYAHTGVEEATIALDDTARSPSKVHLHLTYMHVRRPWWLTFCLLSGAQKSKAVPAIKVEPEAEDEGLTWDGMNSTLCLVLGVNGGLMGPSSFLVCGLMVVGSFRGWLCVGRA